VSRDEEQIVVARTSTVRQSVSVLSIALLLAGCAGTSKRSESVEQVDELLTRIERVQAETAIAKDSVHAALTDLCTLVSPGFKGDAATEFAKFLAASEASEEQAEKLRDITDPMQDSASKLFQRWTKDMEAFGNSRMRQRSQSRLDETRTRFQSIVGATQAAQIALDAFHDDMRDHALFLRHDLNSDAVASIRADVRALNDQIRGLDTRFDATTAAARSYVESAALYGQVEVENTTPVEENTARSTTTTTSPNSTGTPTKKRTVTTLKPKAASGKSSTTSTSSTTTSTTPGATDTPPAPVEPAPTPAPVPETPPQRLF